MEETVEEADIGDAPTPIDRDQKMVILYALHSDQNILITGIAGTGKTYTVECICKGFRDEKRAFTLTALTGAAASLHEGARTLHSALGLGLLKEPVDVLVKRLRSSMCSRRVRDAWASTTLIMDEISVLSGTDFAKLEAVARGVRGNDEPFGGMRLIMVGDLLQLSPVGKADDYVFTSPCWEQCKVARLKLVINARHATDSALDRCLRKVSVGEVDEVTEAFLRSRVREPPVGQVVTELHAGRAAAAEVNASRIGSFVGTDGGAAVTRSFVVETVVHDADRAGDLEYELQNSMVPRELVLAVGADVMLTKSLRGAGLVNRSRGRVVSFSVEAGDPLVRFENGRTTVVRRIEYPIDDANGKKIFTLRQIPLGLAYALTVHRAQGMTLDEVVVDMNYMYQPGQVYVALSRVKTEEGLYIRNLDIASIRASPVVLEYLRGSGDTTDEFGDGE